MVKKLVILSQSTIQKVYKVAKTLSDPKCKKGNFSKALEYILKKYFEKNGAQA